MEQRAALVGVLAVLLAISIGFAWWIWTSLEGVSISMHGWIALAAGAALTMILGVGLMALTFYSARSGHDDDVGPE